MSNIKDVHHEAHLAKIKKLVAQNGFACVTFISDDTGQGNPYHYTVGLTAMGFPEIIITGRLPVDVARAMIEKLVKLWKEDKPKAKLFSTFLRTAQGKTAPAKTKWVMLKGVRELSHADPDNKNPANKIWFASYLWDIYPHATGEFMQLLWADDKGQLPDSPHYTKDEEYLQEILPTEMSIKNFLRAVSEKVEAVFTKEVS
jgi:hypothetical protein